MLEGNAKRGHRRGWRFYHLVHRGKGLPDANALRISLMVLHGATLRVLEGGVTPVPRFFLAFDEKAWHPARCSHVLQILEIRGSADGLGYLLPPRTEKQAPPSILRPNVPLL
jgi:hypothetical protein